MFEVGRVHSMRGGRQVSERGGGEMRYERSGVHSAEYSLPVNLPSLLCMVARRVFAYISTAMFAASNRQCRLSYGVLR